MHDELIINTIKGARFYKSKLKKTSYKNFEKKAEIAHSYDLVIRVADWSDVDRGYGPHDILFDFDTKTFAVSGGNRSGKSQTGVNWLAIRWFYMGGPGAMFWAIAPEMRQAHILLRKLVTGEYSGRKNPAVFPEGLVISYPEHERSLDQHIHMIDGSKIWLGHAKKPGHLKGQSVTAVLWTEVAECKNDSTYTIVKMRTADTKGQVYLDSTPEPRHWMKDQVIDAALEEEIKIKKLKLDDICDNFIRTVKTLSMSSADNPWVDRKEIDRLRASIKNPQQARREVDGEWCSNKDTIYGDVWDGINNVTDMDDPDLSLIGLRDITRQASRGFFGGAGHDWIIGADVNKNPHTFVICKVFGDIYKQETWGLLIYDVVRIWGSDTWGAAKELKYSNNGAYAGAGISIDASAFHKNQPEAHRGGRTSAPGTYFNQFGFNCRPCGKGPNGKPKNPLIRESIVPVKSLMRDNKLIVNATRCEKLIKAIEEQEDAGDGTPIKMSNTYTDREIASYLDALRYAIWGQFNRKAQTKIISW